MVSAEETIMIRQETISAKSFEVRKDRDNSKSHVFLKFVQAEQLQIFESYQCINN